VEARPDFGPRYPRFVLPKFKFPSVSIPSTWRPLQEEFVNVIRRTAAILIATGLSIPALAFSASAATHPGQVVSGQGIGIRLLDASITRKGDPRAHLYIDDFVPPGADLTRHVEVDNLTNHSTHVLMYADASSIDKAGWVVAQGRVNNELTSWMTVTPSTLDLAPGKSAVVTVKIAVPAKASSDERYATIIAEQPATSSGAGMHVAIATRVGVRVYLAVGPGGEPASNFTISTLVASKAPDGTPMVTANVTNTGKRALDVGGTLMLTNGPGGLRAGPYQVSVPKTIGIGETEGVSVALDKQTPLGPWLATMNLKSGYVEHAATATITFPAKGGSAAAPVKAKPVAGKSSFMLPAVLGVIALVIVALIVMWLRRRRRDGDDTGAAERSPEPFVPSQRNEARRPAAQPDTQQPEAISRLRSRQ
jgi:hypothetical protein